MYTAKQCLINQPMVNYCVKLLNEGTFFIHFIMIMGGAKVTGGSVVFSSKPFHAKLTNFNFKGNFDQKYKIDINFYSIQ